MHWIALFIAGCFEVLGVIGLNRMARSKGIKSYIIMFGAFGGSLSLLSYALHSLPMGTAYAIWTGIGTAGGAVVGILLYGESKSWSRMLCIAIILVAAIGLKLTT